MTIRRILYYIYNRVSWDMFPCLMVEIDKNIINFQLSGMSNKKVSTDCIIFPTVCI